MLSLIYYVLANTSKMMLNHSTESSVIPDFNISMLNKIRC